MFIVRKEHKSFNFCFKNNLFAKCESQIAILQPVSTISLTRTWCKNCYIAEERCISRQWTFLKLQFWQKTFSQSHKKKVVYWRVSLLGFRDGWVPSIVQPYCRVKWTAWRTNRHIYMVYHSVGYYLLKLAWDIKQRIQRNSWTTRSFLSEVLKP